MADEKENLENGPVENEEQKIHGQFTPHNENGEKGEPINFTLMLKQNTGIYDIQKHKVFSKCVVNAPRYLGIRQAAYRLGISPSTVLEHIKDNKIPYTLINERKFISEEYVELQERQKEAENKKTDTIRAFEISITDIKNGKITFKETVFSSHQAIVFLKQEEPNENIDVIVRAIDIDRKNIKIPSNRFLYWETENIFAGYLPGSKFICTTNKKGKTVLFELPIKDEKEWNNFTKSIQINEKEELQNLLYNKQGIIISNFILY